MQRPWDRGEHGAFRTLKGQYSWSLREESVVGDEAGKAGRCQSGQVLIKDLEHSSKRDGSYWKGFKQG